MNAGDEKLRTASNLFSRSINCLNFASLYSNLLPNMREQMTFDTLVFSWLWTLNAFPSYFSNSSIRQSTSSVIWVCKQRLPNPNFLMVVSANVLCSFHQDPDDQARPGNGCNSPYIHAMYMKQHIMQWNGDYVQLCPLLETHVHVH